MPDVRICFFEDGRGETFEPLHLFHASWDLFCGTGSLADMIGKAYDGAQSMCTARPELAALYAGTPHALHNELPEGRYLFVNGRVSDPWALADAIPVQGEDAAYYTGQELVAFRMDITAQKNAFESIPRLAGSLRKENTSVPLAHYLWDYVEANAARITADATRRSLGERHGAIHERAVLEKPEDMFFGVGSMVEANAVLDAREGPICIEENVVIRAGAILRGPLFLGKSTIVNSLSRIHSTSIGHTCKVGGEIGESIIMPFSNKQHDGHLGHAYLGSWVNLGADTTNSNLKNTYGNVSVELAASAVDTHLQFAGCYLGDYVKTGIGTLLPTGTVIGAFTNVFGAGRIPKRLPALQWYDATTGTPVAYDVEKALTVMERTMARRQQQLSDDTRAFVRKLSADSTG